MYNHALTTTHCLIAVPLFSLAWFIVGLVAGKQLVPAKPRPAARKPRTGKKKQDTSELYVGNLSYDLKSKDLRRAFEKHGNVRTVRLIENRFTGKSKGFAFIEMGSAADAQAAIKGMNGKELEGRKLVVNVARTRPKE